MRMPRGNPAPGYSTSPRITSTRCDRTSGSRPPGESPAGSCPRRPPARRSSAPLPSDIRDPKGSAAPDHRSWPERVPGTPCRGMTRETSAIVEPGQDGDHRRRSYGIEKSRDHPGPSLFRRCQLGDHGQDRKDCPVLISLWAGFRYKTFRVPACTHLWSRPLILSQSGWYTRLLRQGRSSRPSRYGRVVS